jgi:hypothetical protein
MATGRHSEPLVANVPARRRKGANHTVHVTLPTVNAPDMPQDDIMRVPFLTLMSLLVIPATAQAAEADVHVRGHLMAIPVSTPYVGAGVEVSDDRLRLGLAAEGTTLWDLPPKVWATWLRWTPWTTRDGTRFGVLAGYNQSYRLFPGPGVPPEPGRPDPGWEMPSVLIGMAYEWAGPGWWLRVSPHVAVGYDQSWQLLPTFRSLHAGPPLAEFGWQPVEHLELGLRLSLTPVRVGFHF